MINIAKYPLVIGLLCAVGVVMITQHLAYLVNELKAGIRVEFRFVFLLTFHMLLDIIAICGKKQGKM